MSRIAVSRRISFSSGISSSNQENFGLGCSGVGSKGLRWCGTMNGLPGFAVQFHAGHAQTVFVIVHILVQPHG